MILYYIILYDIILYYIILYCIIIIIIIIVIYTYIYVCPIGFDPSSTYPYWGFLKSGSPSLYPF